MPIYAYKCQSCGFSQDVLQKMSDPALTQCPACDQPAFAKQLTAAGFQLKGSGWYATDFKNPSTTSSAASSNSSPAAPKADTTTAPKDTPPAAAGGACGGSCACH